MLFLVASVGSSAPARADVDPTQGVTIAVKNLDPRDHLPSSGTFTPDAAMAGDLDGGEITITDTQDLTFSDDSAGDEEATSSGQVDSESWSDIDTDNEYQWLVENTQTNEQITIFQIEVEGSVDEYFWGATGVLDANATYEVVSTNSNPDETEGVPYADMVMIGQQPGGNIAPTVNDDSFSTLQDQSLSNLDVLANDTDADGDPLSIVGTFRPNYGTITVNADDTVDYTPAAGFVGIDTFTYTVGDGNNGRDTGTVTIVISASEGSVDPSQGVTIAVKALNPQDYLPDGAGFTLLPSMTGPLDGGEITIVDTVNDTLSEDSDSASGETAISSGRVGEQSWSDAPTNNESQWVVESVQTGEQVTIFHVKIQLGPLSYLHYWGATGLLNADETYGVVLSNNSPGQWGEGVRYADMVLAEQQPGSNTPPVANADSFSTVQGQSLSSLDVLANDTDVDGDTLTVAGTPSSSNGTITVNADDTLNYTPSSGFVGTDTFTYTVNDGNNGSDQGTVTVAVSANGGSLDPSQGVTIAVKALRPNVRLPSTVGTTFTPTRTMAGPLEDGAVTIVDTQDLTFSDDNHSEQATSSGQVGDHSWSDIDTDNESQFVVENTQTNEQITIFTVDVEDSTARVYWGATGELDANATYRLVSTNPNPNASAGVPYADMILTGQQPGGNTPPTANPDSFSTVEGQSLSDLDVLANDTDPDGDPLSIDGTPNAANGTVTVNSDDTLNYVPDTGFFGTDTFTYTVSDGNNGSDQGTVTIAVSEASNPGNTPPTANPDSFSTEEGQSLSDLDVLANDTDPDGDPLSIDGTPNAANGTVTVNSDDTLNYVPDTGFFGTDTFTYTVSDGNNGSDQGTVTVAVSEASGGGGIVNVPEGPFGASDPVGAVAGKLGVTPSGTASYSVPISVPPGTSGVQPSLTLQYSNVGGPGVAGVGWSIGGMSAVTRCPATLLHDGFIDPVDFDPSDKLCLNGERLVPVSGDYLVDGTEYRTSFESFTRVISYGLQGNGPESLKAWQRSGEVFEYGATVDSRLATESGVHVKSWLLNKITDRSGNYISFSYVKDESSGEHRLDRVDYTGNDLQGLSPYNSVEFTYEDRPDIGLAWQGGSILGQSQRLKTITVMAGTEVFRTYNLTYSATSSVSQLVEIDECAGSGVCLTPTSFEWAGSGIDTSLTGFDTSAIGSGSGITGSVFENYVLGGTGDFNGDGLTDVYLYKAAQDSNLKVGFPITADRVFLADGSGSFTEVIQSTAESLPANHLLVTTGDFNGDGLMDLYGYRGEAGRTYKATTEQDYVWLADGDGTFTRTATNIIAERMRLATAGDFNGDGLTDMYFHEADDNGLPTGGQSDRIWLSDGDGTFTETVFGSGDPTAQAGTTMVSGDFNGDGMTDMIWHSTDDHGRIDTVQELRLWRSEGDGTFTNWSIEIPSEISLLAEHKIGAAADFNGDGLTDLFLYKSDTHGRAAGTETAELWLSKGNGSFDRHPTTLTIDSETLPTAGDFNGDGLVDLYFYPASDDAANRAHTGSWADYLWINTNGRSFERDDLGAGAGLTSAHDKYIIGAGGDFDGDGAADLYIFEAHDHGRLSGLNLDFILRGIGSNTPELTRITNGVGLVTEIDYAPLTSASVYTKGTGATYPAIDLVIPQRVVSAVRADTGIGGEMNEQFYSYEQLRAGAGIGSLGFARMSVLDDASGITTISEYSQDHANKTHGLLLSSTTVTAAGTVLEETVNTWNATETTAADGTPLIFRSVSSSTSTRTNLNGSMLAEVITDTQYNAYGFPTTITARTRSLPPVSKDLAATLSAPLDGNQVENGNYVASLYLVLLDQHPDSEGYEFWQSDLAAGFFTHDTMFDAFESHMDPLTDQEYITLLYDRVLETTPDTGGLAFWLSELQNPDISRADVLQAFLRSNEFFVRWLYVNLLEREPDAAGYASWISAIANGYPRETAYDAFANSTERQSMIASSYHIKVTQNTYGADDEANWILGRITAATVTHSAPGEPDIVRSSAFTYDPVTGQLLTETLEPGDALSHTTTNTYDGFGLPSSVTETWGSPGSDGIADTSRTSTFTYDSLGRFSTGETNPLGHSQSNAYDPLFGVVTSATGPNGLTTDFAFDDFGRTTVEQRADGNQTRTYRYNCDGRTCPANAVLFMVTQSDGAPTTTVYQDKLYREVRKTTEMLDGSIAIVDTVYDELGRITSKSEPYYTGDTDYWTSVTYDILGRPIKTLRPDGSTQRMDYFGRVQISINENGQTKTVEKDSLGRTIRVEDTQGNITTYDYDAAGQLTRMRDPLGNTQTTVYDIRGNKIAMSDPDRGSWTYRYNALGMLVDQTDAAGQVTQMTYDMLGRMLTRTDDATGSPSTATWEFDLAAQGIGKLYRAYQPGYEAVSAYDSYGRPSATTETIDGTSYTVTTGYDTYSRADTLTYPSGFATRNVYTASGHLSQVQYASSGVMLWEATQMDARGNITHFKLGNGAESIRTHDPENGRITAIQSTHDQQMVQDLTYEFDPVGNLTRRTDARQGYTETAVYDDLNRVIQVVTQTGVDGSGMGNQPPGMWDGTTTTVAVTYNVLGNIMSKTDIGAYGYGESLSACSGVTGAVAAAGPRAVSSTLGHSTADYCYDANGNLLSGDGRTVTWTAFGKPQQISRGLSSVSLTYGPDRARYKRIDTTATSTKTTTYVGGKLYEVIDTAGTIEQKHYVGGFAVLSTTTSSSVPVAYYMLSDHLGSVDTVLGATGEVIERMSFDPWGKRRQANWAPIDDPTGYMPLVTTRGFTNHEQLDTVGLVHMNGRVYDPELGRFLSADPVIQDISNLQAWNAYSYVLNNPLSYTDPTGFFFKAIVKAIGNLFKAVFRAIRSVVRAIARIPILSAIIKIVACSPFSPAGPIGCVAVSAALTLGAGGSLGDALISAALSFVQLPIGEIGGGIWGGVHAALEGVQGALEWVVKPLVHGAIGGALSVIQGGEFLAGFASGAAGAIGGLASIKHFNFALPGSDNFGASDFWGSTAVAAVAGGTGSALAGGKFANGAVTAAFANMYNAMMMKRELVGPVGGERPSFRWSGRNWFRRLFGRGRSGGCSFQGDTRVKTHIGMIAISELVAGAHLVWSRDPSSEETGWRLVIAPHAERSERVVLFKIKGISYSAEEEIVSDDIHPTVGPFSSIVSSLEMATEGTTSRDPQRVPAGYNESGYTEAIGGYHD